ncbi:MAG TPA: hypothetical protein VMY99_03940 [Nevskiaceae bacterium]|nr:hypothetical protein [Nevskiaceae bacterium]
MAQHHIIYVPGLSDSRADGQGLATKAWVLYGVKGHCLRMHWADGEPFAPKLQRLLDTIDELAAAGHTVSLVGASAGASAVLQAFAARKDTVAGVVCICGKIQHPETVRDAVYAENPAFMQAMKRLSTSLHSILPADRARILSIHPRADNSVPPEDTIIEGAVEKTIPTSGHARSIFYALTVGAPTVVGFLKARG